MPCLTRRLSLILFALLASTLSAQNRSTVTAPVVDGEWRFARLVYQGNGRDRSRYTTDYPEAEIHLRQGLSRLTRIDTGEPVFIRPDVDELTNHPWLYAVEVGSWYLDDREAAAIREYLLRGGFLLVDDFWGDDQWFGFEDSMRRVFPDRPIVELDETDTLMNMIYDLDTSIQIPGRGYYGNGVTWQNGGTVPHWRGIYDDQDRLMVAINFNMDLGDAWEHADDPYYPEAFTGLAYRFAVNYVIYSMTH
jgi:hypothetical protein